MADAPKTPPILHTRRPPVRDVISGELKGLGHEKILATQEKDECIEALVKNPGAILIVDWALGGPHVNAVLASIKSHFLVETRPIFLVIDELEDDVVATGAEYGVSQIHAGPVEPASIRECLIELLKEEAQTRSLRAALVLVAQARAKKDWQLATSLLEDMHAKDPAEGRIALELAENLIVEGEWTKAIALVEPVARTDVPNIRALHLLGRCYLGMGRYDESIACLKRAKLINPHNVDRLVDLGNAFFKNHQIDEAKANFAEAGKLDAGSKAAKVGTSKCLLMTGDVNEALALMRTVSGPREMASIFNTAAVLAMRVGQFDKGMSLYKSAINALGKNDLVASRLYFNMGLGYRRWSKLDRALACFTRSLELDGAFEKARRHKQLAETALGGAPAPLTPAKADKPQAEDPFAEEDLGARGARGKIVLPKDEAFGEPLADEEFPDDD